jgi:hypothetical protein
MNMKNKLDGSQWSAENILELAVRGIYPIYVQLHIMPPLLTDLRDATKDLVTAYLWLFMADQEKKKEAIDLILLVIENGCRHNGLGYSEQFRAELYSWILELESTYKYSKEVK